MPIGWEHPNIRDMDPKQIYSLRGRPPFKWYHWLFIIAFIWLQFYVCPGPSELEFRRLIEDIVYGILELCWIFISWITELIT